MGLLYYIIDVSGTRTGHLVREPSRSSFFRIRFRQRGGVLHRSTHLAASRQRKYMDFGQKHIPNFCLLFLLLLFFFSWGREVPYGFSLIYLGISDILILREPRQVHQREALHLGRRLSRDSHDSARTSAVSGAEGGGWRLWWFWTKILKKELLLKDIQKTSKNQIRYEWSVNQKVVYTQKKPVCNGSNTVQAWPSWSPRARRWPCPTWRRWRSRRCTAPWSWGSPADFLGWVCWACWDPFLTTSRRFVVFKCKIRDDIRCIDSVLLSYGQANCTGFRNPIRAFGEAVRIVIATTTTHESHRAFQEFLWRILIKASVSQHVEFDDIQPKFS